MYFVIFCATLTLMLSSPHNTESTRLVGPLLFNLLHCYLPVSQKHWHYIAIPLKTLQASVMWTTHIKNQKVLDKTGTKTV